MAIQMALPAPETFVAGPITKDNLDENSHPYVGLVNQAMTCYLNSLIQTLYMTPEFRNAIYNWKFNGSQNEEVKNIPYQLQKLFLQLQTSDKHSLETKDLTASFGWESHDAYDQHDVQELCRLMFDALEHRWKKTENHSLIQDLYKGTMEDYVKCLNCGTEKLKPDVFLDLPLAVKQFGAADSYKSVEEALRAFIKPEVLDGNNQYQCEKCNSKQDAEKGLRITHFPYLLTIQLKRFDFDYISLQRIKLNDKMTFPDFLDINEFVYDRKAKPAAQVPKMSYATMAKKQKTASTVTTIKENEELSVLEDGANSTEDSSYWLNEERDSEAVTTYLKKGKYIYELISIMVHQGNAAGGHYFAYIKNVDQNRWFCFNDSSVNSAQMSEIFRTFGGPSGGWYTSNTNAYMLMYRRVEPTRNKHFIRTIDLPPHLNELKEKLIQDENERIKRQQYEENHIKVNYICNDEKYIQDEPGCTNIFKTVPLTSVLYEILAKFELSEEIDARLILCDSHWNMKEHLENLTDDKLLESIANFEYSPLMKPDVYLMLDTRLFKGPEFYLLSKIKNRTFEVCLVDLANETIRLVKRVSISLNTQTIAEVKQMLCIIPQVNDSNPNDLRIVIDPIYEDNPLIIINDDDDKTFERFPIPSYGKITIFVDVGPLALLELDRDENKDIHESKMIKIINRKKFNIRLKIILPSPADYRRAGMIPYLFDPNSIPQILPISNSEAASAGRISPAGTETSSISNMASTVSNNAYIGNLTVMERPHNINPIYNQCTASTSTLNYTTISSVENNPKYLRGLSTSYNLQDAPPPPYSIKSPEQCSPDQASPVSSTNLDDDDRMDTSPCLSTPKRSPDVSEGSGDEINERSNFSSFFMNAKSNELEMVNTKLLRLVENQSQDNNWNSMPGTSANVETSEREKLVNNEDKDSACDTLLGGESTSDSSPSTSVFAINVVSTDLLSDSPYCEVELDKRQLESHFKTWISQFINVEPTNFSIFKHYSENDDGYLLHSIENETVKDAFLTVDHLHIKLNVSTKGNEKVVIIGKFDLEQSDQQKWNVLFHLPASIQTTVEELLEKCQELLARTCEETYNIRKLRLRDLAEGGAVALKRSDKLEQRGTHQWHRNLYLQIIDKESGFKGNIDEYIPVMVIRWCPSTLNVMPVFEVDIPANSADPSKDLRKSIAKKTMLPIERIEISTPFPNLGWSKWPYTKGILELYENVEFSKQCVIPESGLNGKLVYFKDSNEFKKNLLDEERKAIRIKENAVTFQASNSARRRERPLRIQMSSISETDP